MRQTQRPRPKPEDMTGDTPCHCGCPLDEHRASTDRECLKCGKCEKFRAAKEPR